MTDLVANRRNRFRYKAVPLPFEFNGVQYIATHSNNLYGCPFPECGKLFKIRDSIQHHIFDHGVDNKTKLFMSPLTGGRLRASCNHDRAFVLTQAVAGQQATQGNDDPSEQDPAPTELAPQGVDSEGQNAVITLYRFDDRS